MTGRSEVSRRHAIATALAALGGGMAAPVLAQDPRGPGAPPGPRGDRSPHARLERRSGTTISLTPLGQLVGTITPADLHYEVHHAGIPSVDPARWSMVVHGRGARPLRFTLADLLRMPSRTVTCFLECGGNYRVNAPRDSTPQFMAGLTSQTEWTGVPVRQLLSEVGVTSRRGWMLAEGQDGAALSRSIPLRKVWDDAILAYGQNGEPLRPSQGFLVRLLVPGYEGNMSVKWLGRLEVGAQPFMTRWETSRYSELLPDGRIRQFSFLIEARSIITDPAPPRVLEPGWHEIRGLAWSGAGRIRRVEVTVDGGRSWQKAELQDPVLPRAHTRFRMPWRWTGEPAALASRATDETGYVQPTQQQLISRLGHQIPYHMNPIITWAVDPTGVLALEQEPWPE